MTDLAFIVDTSDAALPVGRAAAPVSTDSTAAGSFSGMLGERLQSGLEKPPQAKDFASQTVASTTVETVKSDVSEPIDGKPLPLLPSSEESALQDSAQAGLAKAALLAAIAQSAPSNTLNNVSGVATTAAADSPVTDGDLLEQPSLPGGVLNTLGQAVQAVQAETSTNSPKAAAVSDAQLPAASLAKQLASGTSSGLPAEKQDARLPNSPIPATNITPSLLAQPVTESAQRALVLAMNDAGLAKRVAPSIGAQLGVSPVVGERQTGASSLANGLTPAMQLAGLMAKTPSTAEFEASAVGARLAQQTTAPLTSVTPLVTSSGAEDVSSLIPLAGRVSTPVGGGFMPTMSVATPVGQAGWANEMGQRVAWLAQGDLREAQLQLHPRSLGPVEVRIAYGHEQQLNVSFTAANPLAREALDAALPRLREMFEQQGLNLADANISQHSFSEQAQQESEEGEPGSNPGNWSVDTDELTEQAMLSNRVLMGDGMLDAYA